jgi:hypothetical protein
MKTDDLINAIAADARQTDPPIARTLAIAVGVGLLVSAAGFLAVLGVRDNFMESLTWPRFIFKFVLTMSMVIPAFMLVRVLARPDYEPDRRMWWLILAPVMLFAAVLVELAVVPSEDWHARMMGRNSVPCMIVIPLLSLAPLAATLYGLRQGAPTHPVVAGAIGGLLSAGLGATLYASHCPDDSPLFLAAWYTVAFVLTTAVGALLGSRLLRW